MYHSQDVDSENLNSGRGENRVRIRRSKMHRWYLSLGAVNSSSSEFDTFATLHILYELELLACHRLKMLYTQDDPPQQGARLVRSLRSRYWLLVGAFAVVVDPEGFKFRVRG